jgi:uncharacterized membrane protein
VLLPADLALSLRVTLAWISFGLVYLLLVARLMWTEGVEDLRARAARQDDSGTVILLIVLLAIAASFAAIAGVLGEAKAAQGPARLAYLALVAGTILVSWFVTQVVFALHYAHEFYAPPASERDAENGLEFPHDTKPDYWDFFYFSTTVGATSQTSDTGVKSKSMRRLVTLHSIVSFFFNTMVLALTINLAASLI